jgi:hypothetical protein
MVFLKAWLPACTYIHDPGITSVSFVFLFGVDVPGTAPL